VDRIVIDPKKEFPLSDKPCNYVFETCRVCSQPFHRQEEFNGHLRSHKIRIADYYHKYYPRYDLYSNELINFKDKGQYFSTNFNTRSNFSVWFKSQNEAKQKEYCIEFLKKRKLAKNLVYSPSQTELRSLFCPGVAAMQKLFGNYYELCNSLGLQNKYQPFDSLPQIITSPYKVICDTREQKPLKFPEVEVKKLDFGDYLIYNDKNEVYFERKSLADFISTLSSGYERFTREIDRALLANKHLIIVVEENIGHALSFNHLPHISKRFRVTPSFIFHNVRELYTKFPNIQFLFVDGRPRLVEVMIKIFKSGPFYKLCDLELLYETNKL